MRKLSNPFLVYGYESPEYFCDRDHETAELLDNLCNGWNVTLISPRRMGKTGLIKNAFYHLAHGKGPKGINPKDIICVYADIFSTNSLDDFVRVLGSALLSSFLSKGEKFMRKVIQFFAAWRPVVSVDPMSGEPSVSVTLDPHDDELNLKQIFDMLGASDKEIFVAIDEFQQIMSYPETGTEALLRSYTQFVHNVHFVFSGSKRHLMTELFLSPARPFYQSTRIMNLSAIKEQSYYEFANKFFQKAHMSLSSDAFHECYELLEGHTWYMQSILKVLYGHGESVTDNSPFKNAVHELVQDNTPSYETILSLLPERQQKLLSAIAKEGYIATPTSGNFVSRYHLVSASSVSSAIRVLMDKELVYKSEKGYSVYDRFFGLWLKYNY